MDLLEKAEKHSRKLQELFCKSYVCCADCPYYTYVVDTCDIDRNLSDLRRHITCSE